jgi:hypothetical protein
MRCTVNRQTLYYKRFVTAAQVCKTKITSIEYFSSRRFSKPIQYGILQSIAQNMI